MLVFAKILFLRIPFVALNYAIHNTEATYMTDVKVHLVYPFPHLSKCIWYIFTSIFLIALTKPLYMGDNKGKNHAALFFPLKCHFSEKKSLLKNDNNRIVNKKSELSNLIMITSVEVWWIQLVSLFQHLIKIYIYLFFNRLN